VGPEVFWLWGYVLAGLLAAAISLASRSWRLAIDGFLKEPTLEKFSDLMGRAFVLMALWPVAMLFWMAQDRLREGGR